MTCSSYLFRSSDQNRTLTYSRSMSTQGVMIDGYGRLSGYFDHCYLNGYSISANASTAGSTSSRGSYLKPTYRFSGHERTRQGDLTHNFKQCPTLNLKMPRYLLNIRLDGGRIHFSNRICYALTDVECLLLHLAMEVDEKRIGVAINNPGSPTSPSPLSNRQSIPERETE